MPLPEPSIRVLIGKIANGQAQTALRFMHQLPAAEAEGWVFIAADPDDLADYLAWLYKREIEQS